MTPPEDPVGPLPPDDELDELASARLDGVASADEDARADEPAIRAQVEARRLAFEQVRAAIAAPVAIDAGARERAIAAALAAFDEPAAADATGPTEPGRDELATRRDTPRGGRGLRLVGAAAAVIAAVALGASILGGGEPSDDAASEGANAEAGGIEASDSPSVDDGAASPEEPGTLEVARLGDLGEFESLTALSDALVSARSNGLGESDSETEAATEGDATGLNRCSALAAGADAELRSLVATATIDGAPVEVWAVTGDDLVVIDEACDVVILPSP